MFPWVIASFAFLSANQDSNAFAVSAPATGSVTVKGLRRTFLYDAPRSCDKKTGLVLVSHGFGDSPESQRSFSGFAQIADKHNFVFAYLEGIKDKDGKRNFNVEYQFQDPKIDELAYVSAVVNQLCRKFRISRNRVFCTGMSNGADLCYYLARQPKLIIQAAAPVAGCMMACWNKRLTKSNRIPIMEVHGTADDVTKWEGDMANKDGWGAYLGTDSVVKWWVDKQRLERFEVSSVSEKVQLKRWFTDRHSTEFLLYIIDGGKHEWPTNLGDPKVPPAETILRFFEKHSPS